MIPKTQSKDAMTTKDIVIQQKKQKKPNTIKEIVISKINPLVSQLSVFDALQHNTKFIKIPMPNAFKPISNAGQDLLS